MVLCWGSRRYKVIVVMLMGSDDQVQSERERGGPRVGEEEEVETCGFFGERG